MNKAVWFAGLIILSLVASTNSHAEGNELLGISNSRKADMNRISILFDRIPEVEVDTSGQRVRVRMPHTRFSGSFRQLPADELISPLVQVKTEEGAGQSVIEFYFRDVPGFVDVSADEPSAMLNVNVFWNRKGSGSRPGIMGRSFGRLQPIKGGAAAEKVMQSRYSGKWLDFFKEYEWPSEIRLPIRFSFPGFPSPLTEDHTIFLPPEVLQAGKQEAWPRASARMAELVSGDGNVDPYRLLLSECLLRSGDADGALDALDRIEALDGDKWTSCWKSYFRSYALAISGRHFLAGNAMAAQVEACLGLDGLAPWYRILQAEIDLAVSRPEKALLALDRPARADGRTAGIEKLRRADAFYRLGQSEKAFALYSETAADPSLFRRYPASMANWSAALYAKKEYARAAEHYLTLSEDLEEGFKAERGLALYRSAMARLHQGDGTRARMLFADCHKKYAGTEAGFRAWLKLIDMDLLDAVKIPNRETIAEYDVIIEDGPSRRLREEAFFKRILVSHLSGDNLGAVKFLGRFLEDYWAGELTAEAQALLIELMPKVIEELVERQDFLPAIALVAKHRELLAQAPITYDFLTSLARSYTRAGFLEQAAVAYLYILDFEKTPERKQDVYLPLIRLYSQQNKYEEVREYASAYLETYPKGEQRKEVLYHHADALYRLGDRQGAIRILHDGKRVESPELDRLTADIFYDSGQFELAERYYARAGDAGGGDPAEILFKRAEALFNIASWHKAVPLYESLLQEPEFGGQAGFRLIQIHFEEGRDEEALKIYDRMTEMKVGKQWLEMAGETVRIRNALSREY